MKITDLKANQKLTIQITLGELGLEFATFVMQSDTSKVYVKPYYHNGSAIEFNIDRTGEGVCTVYAIDPDTDVRVSWNRVEIETVHIDGEVMYQLKTGTYNLLAKSNDRRKHRRIVVQTKGRVVDAEGRQTDVLVHDISDNGVSFYAPASFSTGSNQVTLDFVGKVEGKSFEITLDLMFERIVTKMGNSLYGCSIASDTGDDYLLYEFLLRSRKKGDKEPNQ